jgi:hypothetical protein
MMAEPEDEDDEEEWEVTPHKFGAHIIDEIAMRTAPKQVYGECKPLIERYFGSQNPFERRSALGALTVFYCTFVLKTIGIVPRVWRHHDR